MNTAASLERAFFQSSPELWGITRALKHSSKYRAAIMALLDEKDRAKITAYSESIRAAKGKDKATG